MNLGLVVGVAVLMVGLAVSLVVHARRVRRFRDTGEDYFVWHRREDLIAYFLLALVLALVAGYACSLWEI